MIATNRGNKVLIRILLWGLILAFYAFVVPDLFAQTYDFDDGIEVLTDGLISKRGEALRNKEVAVFGIIESKSGKKLEISSHIEDGIIDVLVNEGYTVIERRRIDDVIKKEIKKSADLWFDEAQVAQFGKLVGADIVVTGRYIRWGQSILKVSIRAINVSDGKILAANKVKILTDRIAGLLKPEKKEKHPKAEEIDTEKKAAPKKKAKKFSLESPLIGTWSGQYTELRKDGKGKIRWFPITVKIWQDAGKFQADDGDRVMECDGSETSIQCHYKMSAKRGGTYTFSIGSNPNILSASETHYGSKIFDTVKFRDMRKK